ncbi:MAG: cation-translocating P-type ATPase, partial [Verrucomicrobia bacterium]|nr:cation-translocating P-type ATPase [Verrucomicrobiota bacterium]
MTCAHCVRRVQEASQAVLGAGDVDVDLDSGELTVRSKPGAIPDAAAVVQALRAVGYPALLIAPDPGTPERTSSPSAGNAWRRSTVVGLACAVPLMLGEWVFRWHHTPWFTALSAGLATVAMAVSGQRFARGAWNQARAGAFGMDALVTLGSGAAYLFSGVGWLTGLHAHLYFLEATAILAFISGGHWLEARTSAHAEGALRSLLQLAPETACLQTASGEEQSTPIADLRIGDRVVVRSGDRVPTDAEVAEGMSTLDESMLTGESIPVAKGPGDSLYAGTVNREGRMIARVTASGENTALAQVIAAVRRAQSSRAGIQRLADRISQVFVPCVVLTAVGCVVAWGFFPQAMLTLHDSLAVWLWSSPLQADPWANAVIQATAVLVVACPCAMGLATPAALMAAANSAARRGILIRDAIALEKAGKLSTIVFDKTGTLTSGAPSLVNRAFAPECASIDGAPELEALAAGLAFNSKHPLSQALGRLSERPAEWVDVREFAGCGLEGRLGSSRGGFPAGVVGRVGSIEWLRGLGVSLESLEPALIQWKQSGVSCVGFAVGSRIVACFGLK